VGWRLALSDKLMLGFLSVGVKELVLKLRMSGVPPSPLYIFIACMG